MVQRAAPAPDAQQKTVAIQLMADEPAKLIAAQATEMLNQSWLETNGISNHHRNTVQKRLQCYAEAPLPMFAKFSLRKARCLPRDVVDAKFLDLFCFFSAFKSFKSTENATE